MRHPHPFAVVCLALLLAVAFAVRVRLIAGSMPYVLHGDEPAITQSALRILERSDWNPRFFDYPSLSIYLTTGMLAVGFLKACAGGEISNLREVGRVSFPYYERPSVVWPARLLFAAISIVALALVGVAGFLLTRDSRLLVLAPLVTSLSSVFQAESWQYVNVDILAATFALAVLCHALATLDAPPAPRHTLVSGVLSGLALGSKYNRFTALAPALLALLMREPRARLFRAGLLCLVAFATFLAVTPYAVLDVHRFLNAVGHDAYHYASGHRNYDGPAGWAQLWYYVQRLGREFGLLTPLFVVLGAARALRIDARRAALALTLPVAHLAYMSAQKVHFVRNVTEVYALTGLLVAIGLVEAHERLAAVARRSASLRERPERARRLAAVLLAATFIVAAPWDRVSRACDLSPDSRNLAARWLRKQTEPGTALLVPDELGMDVHRLATNHPIVAGAFAEQVPPADASHAFALVPLFDFKNQREQQVHLAHERAEHFAGWIARPRAHFGSRGVLLHRPFSVPGGDPDLTVVELELRR